MYARRSYFGYRISDFRLLDSGFWILASVFLQACSDPVETRFVGLCVDGGDTVARCRCTYEMLETDLRQDIDDEFVSFVADFANWSVPPGGRSLEREAIMAKYDLSDEDFRYLAEVVGRTLIKAFNSCGDGPEWGPIPAPEAED